MPYCSHRPAVSLIIEQLLKQSLKQAKQAVTKLKGQSTSSPPARGDVSASGQLYLPGPRGGDKVD